MVARIASPRAPQDTTDAGGRFSLARIQRVWDVFAALDAFYRERGYLAEMDEHMLRDIGLTRADIEAERRRPIPWLRLLLGRGGPV